MPVVTDEQYQIALVVERISREYTVPKEKLMQIVRLSFEAGQKDGVQAAMLAVV